MRNYISIAIIIAFVGCKKEVAKVDELPVGMVQTTPDSTIYPRLLETFPQSVNNKITHSSFFADGIQKKIVITKSTLVYMTFINENAEAKNSVGWYSYDKNNPPTKRSDIKMHILFPNASMEGNGGKLKSGDMLQLQTEMFTPGTVIGFFLIANGYQNGTIVWSQPIFFTDYNLNKDLNQQHVLYIDKDSGDIVLSFEDTPSNMNSDSDYDDVVFTISDNVTGTPPQSFDLNGIVVN